MAQNLAIDAGQKMPRKRTSTFVNFLGRILPSHRPEQGGTLRMQDDKSTESAYRDLAIDPETLTHWSIAQDLPVGNHEHTRCRTASPRPRNPPQASVVTRQKRSRTVTARKPKAPPQRGKALSAAEIHALLKSKEKVRLQRRAQKARGDWLGVTGADPQLGEYPVLTPTDSPSSDTTAPSDVDKMAKLAEEEKQAKMAYDAARHRKEEERERLELEKAHNQLGKIERSKSGQRLRHQSGKWIRGRGHWASVAGPGLSTITQSSASYEQIRNTPGHETVPAPVSATDPASVPAQEIDGQAGPGLPSLPYAGGDNALGRPPSARHVSTGTVIHTPASEQSDHHIELAEPVPESQHGTRSEPEPAKSQLMPSGKHFLWGRRRRVTVPGDQVPTRAATASLTTTMDPVVRFLSPDPEPGRRKDHFTGLIIPDHHLGSVHMGREQEIRMLAREKKLPPLPTDNDIPGHRACGGPVPWQSRGKAQEKHAHSQGDDPVTVISSQSRSNSSTKHLCGTLKSIMEPMNGDRVTSEGYMDQDRPHQSPPAPCGENKPPGDGNPGMAEQGLRAVVSKPRKEADDGKQRRCLSVVERKSEMIETIKAQGVSSGPDSAYTPTTITTGCAVSLLIRPISQALLEPMNELGDGGITPMSAKEGTMQSGVCSALSSLQGPDRPSLARTAPKGELKEVQNQAAPDHDARTGPDPIRCFKPGRENEPAPSRRTARKADGTIGPKITQTSTAAAHGPKTPPPPIRAPPPVPIPAVQCGTTTGQEAARTAMLRARAREAMETSAPETKKGQRQNASPSRAKNEVQKQQHAGDAVDTDAHSQPAGTDTPAPAPAPAPAAPKRDAVATIRAAGACATCGVCAAAWGWWEVVQPAFDSSSNLWARRSRQQSTWVDVAVFSLAGVSCLFGMVVGLHAFQVLWWLVRL